MRQLENAERADLRLSTLCACAFDSRTGLTLACCRFRLTSVVCMLEGLPDGLTTQRKGERLKWLSRGRETEMAEQVSERTAREIEMAEQETGLIQQEICPIHFDFFRYHLPCVTHGKRLSHLYHVFNTHGKRLSHLYHV